MGLDVAGDLGAGGPEEESIHEIHLSVRVAPRLDGVRDVLGHVFLGMVLQEAVDVRAGHVRVGGAVDGIAGYPVGQREIDLFEVGEPLESFPDAQVQIPRRDDFEGGLDDELRTPGLLVRPVLPAEHVPSRRRNHQAAAGSVLPAELAQETDPFELAQRGEYLRLFLVAEDIRSHVGRGTGQYATKDLVQVYLCESHAQLKNARQCGYRGGLRPVPGVPEGQQVRQLFGRGQCEPGFEFIVGTEAPVFYTRQSAPPRIVHDEAHLLGDFLRIRQAVRHGFLPIHHGVEGPFVGQAPVREPRRVVAQAVHEGEDVPDRGEVPAFVVFRFRRFRREVARQPVREIADQHVAQVFRHGEVDGAVRRAAADYEPPVQQSVELFDQSGVGGFSRVVDASRIAGRQNGQQDLPGVLVQIVHALIDVPRLEDLVRDFADQAGAGDHAGLHAEG